MTPNTLAGGAAGLSIFGTVLNASGQISQARALEQQAGMRSAEDIYEANQLTENAGQVFAASQRTAINQNLQTQYVASHALAVGAASGGGTGGSLIDTIAKINGMGTYRSMSALYEGQSQARQMEMQAAGKRYQASAEDASAENIKRALPLEVGATVLSGAANVGSMYAKYWAGPTGGNGGGGGTMASGARVNSGAM